MVFAGEVFSEWYWGPLLFCIVFGLPLSAAALAVDFAVRRWVRRLAWPERAALWVGVLVGGSLAILGGRALIDHVRFERDAKAAVRNLDFKPYATEGLPDGLTEEGVHADDYVGTPVIVSRYDHGPGAYAFAYQQAPREVSLQDGHCVLGQLAGASTNFFDGPCRELRTPRGRTVYLGTLEHLVDGGEAFALLDGTLVRLDYVQVTDRDVLAYFDSLRPIAPDDIDFKKG